jgi:hypothetical protein
MLLGMPLVIVDIQIYTLKEISPMYDIINLIVKGI